MHGKVVFSIKRFYVTLFHLDFKNDLRDESLGECMKGNRQERRPRSPAWLRRLALGTWNVTSLVGKEPELVWEAERYQPHLHAVLEPNIWRGAGWSGIHF